jgi:hypothetical protein
MTHGRIVANGKRQNEKNKITEGNNMIQTSYKEDLKPQVGTQELPVIS